MTVFTTHCPSDRANTLVSPGFTPNHVGASTVRTWDATGGPGNRRGVLCYFHPSATSDAPMPLNFTAINLGNAQGVLPSVANPDGWVVDFPAYPADWSINGQGHIANFFYAAQADPNAVLTAYLAWWDHYESYVADRFGSNIPIVIGGFSMGAWVTGLLAGNVSDSANIVGAFMHALPTIWENVDITTALGQTLPMSSISWGPLDLGPHLLDGAPFPCIIGYCNTDNIVGYSPTGGPNNTVHSNTLSIITNAQAAGVAMTGYESTADETNTGPGTSTWTNFGGGHLFLEPDLNTYCSPSSPAATTTPALSQGWLQQMVDPNVPVNTF